VAHVNQAPVAHNDSATTAFNTPVTINVLSNDSDVDVGDILTVTGIGTSPTHGSVQINAGTTITYTPTTGYIGGDSFTYNISDGHGGTAPATVNITVLAAASYIGTAAAQHPDQFRDHGRQQFLDAEQFGRGCRRHE